MDISYSSLPSLSPAVTAGQYEARSWNGSTQTPGSQGTETLLVASQGAGWERGQVLPTFPAKHSWCPNNGIPTASASINLCFFLSWLKHYKSHSSLT